MGVKIRYLNYSERHCYLNRFLLVTNSPFDRARVDVVLFQQRCNHVEIVSKLREDDHTCRRFFLEQVLKVVDETRQLCAIILDPVVFGVLWYYWSNN